MRALKIPTSLLTTMLIVAACVRRPEPIRVDGSPGVLPLVAALATAYRADHGGGEIVLASGLGSAARLDALADGTIDVAMASHGIVNQELQRRGLTAHEIARMAVVFAVNGGVPVATLTRAQVCDILAGRTASWQEFGGGDVRIAPRMRPASEVDTEVATAGVECLRTLRLGSPVRIIERPDSMAAALASTPGAFGVTSMTMVQASLGRITALQLDGVAPNAANVASGVYALTRRAFLVAKAPPPPHVTRFLAFVRSTEGERVIRANGGIPVTP